MATITTKRTSKSDKSNKVFSHDNVLVEFTEKSKFHKKGEKKEVHRLLANKYETSGVAKVVDKVVDK